MGRLLTEASRWMLLATLVSAPLLYGSTRSWTANLLIAQLLTIGALSAAGCCVSRRKLEVSPVLLAVGGYLIVHAWWMALNAKFLCDAETIQFTPLSALVPAAPGSIDRRLSVHAALLVTGLVIAVWLAADMALTSQWRRRLLFAMAATGGLVACVGLLQRFTGAPDIYWGQSRAAQSFFGPYRNHDNAAAFINVAWPLAGGLFVAALHDPRLWRCILWGATVVIGIVGAMVSGSRAGGLVAFIIVALLTAWSLLQARAGRLGNVRLPELIVATLLLFGLMVAVAVFTGVDFSLRRWSALEGELTAKNYRWIAYQICLKMAPEAGWFGFGPGTFQCAFPYFTHEAGEAIKGRWTHAHQDYLQTIIEWGYVGALAWCVFVGGAFVASIGAFVKNGGTVSFNRRCEFAASILAMGGVLLHALVDFPLQIPSIQLYVCVLLGILWHAPGWFVSRSRSPDDRITTEARANADARSHHA